MENEIPKIDAEGVDRNINTQFEETKGTPIIPEPMTMKELIVDSLVSSKNFFVKEINKKITEGDDVISYRLKLKINDEYKEALENNENFRPNKYGDKPLFREEALLKKKTERNILEGDRNTPKSIEKVDNASIMKLEDVIAVDKKNEILNKIPEKYKIDASDQKNENLVLSLYKNQTHLAFRKNKVVQPEWHAPWKLYRVISGHTGWVRCIDVDPTNNWFVTGSNDKMIKFWDLASGKLKLSLTGHINTVRGVVVSPRHPYLFSCGEDKEIKCWDLEQNKVVRHYHGHLSGIHSIALHPTLDILVTGGRDCVGRVWDIRSREQIFCLEGHTNTIASVACQEYNPQVITGSYDSTVKLWDMTAGKCMTTITHHKKSIRSLITHHDEYTFISGGVDNVKVWQCPEGRFLRNISGHNSIINSIALNKDGILVSGSDNGSLFMWDYKSGYNFQQIESKVQPGSLSSEAGIFAIKFDKSSTRMITAECDKTIKMWKEDEDATPENYPINN